MRIKRTGVWVTGRPLIKIGAGWKRASQTLIKVGGVWSEMRKGILKDFFSGTITVGKGAAGQYTPYGYNPEAGIPYGSISNTKTKSGHTIRYFITGDKEHVGAAPFRWIEMCVIGDISGLDIGDIQINNVIGRFNRNIYSTVNGNTYVNWVFDAPIAVSGQWVSIA